MKQKFIPIIILVNMLLNSSSAQNYVSTYSGSGSGGYVNGSIDTASYRNPFGLCIDKYKNLYIADGGNNCIRKIEINSGVVSTFAGDGTAGYRDGAADSARFNSPSDVCVDDSGNVYVSDFQNQRIRKISPAGYVSTIAGSGTAGFLDGTAATARFNYPRGICRDTQGNIYIGDSWNHRIRKIDMGGNVSTYAGGGTSIGVSSVGGLIDGADTSARFYTPSGLCIDGNGNIYVADAYNHRIRFINSSRIVSTVAGTGTSGPGNGGFLNGDVSIAILNTPTELFIDTSNNELYISDTFNYRIRRLNFNTSDVSTLAGSGLAAFTDSFDTFASFNYPRGIVKMDSIVSTFFIVDYNNHAIRKISPSNISNIDEKELQNVITLYPNPAKERVTILSEKSIRKIYVYDVFGNIRNEFHGDGSLKLGIDIALFPEGIYILKLIDVSGRVYSKIIVHE